MENEIISTQKERGFCPSCEGEQDLLHIFAREIINIRGEEIPARAEYYRCENCGEEFEKNGCHDELKEAYAEYRRRKGLPPDAPIV